MAGASIMNKLVISKSVKSSGLFALLPWYLRLYSWPFFIIYCIAIACLICSPAFSNNGEFFLLLVGLVLLMHAITYLSCFWSVSAKAHITCRKVLDLPNAEFILVIPIEHKGSGQLAKLNFLEKNGQEFCWFAFQKKKFIYDFDKKHFRKLSISFNDAFKQLKETQGLQSNAEISELIELYGPNSFDIPLPTFNELFKEHAVAPFFVFQLFCVGLWCLDEFWYYAIFTLLMLFVFESTVVHQRIRNLKEFRTMSNPPFPVFAKRHGSWMQISSLDLLPGDLCALVHEKEEVTVPCDLLLLEGSCIVNEAMLSGESTPLLKESISDRNNSDQFDIECHNGHVIFGGTRILQTNAAAIDRTPCNGCLFKVLRTGFYSQQGKLIRTIVFSTERMTANNKESLLFILFLLVFAVAAAIYVWIKGSEEEGRNRYKLLLECVLIVTAVVPPELPMELSLAVNTALIALSKFAIYCTEPFRIPFAGKIDVCCFDKTGTLTDDKLILEGIAGLNIDGPKILEADNVPLTTVQAIAACHTLLQLNGKIDGDPMEVAAMQFIKWTLESNDTAVSIETTHSVKILKRYPFSSSLKRMATISSLMSKEDNLFVSVKGAPETIAEMLSVVPSFYEDVFTFYAKRGARVIAIAYKKLSKINLNEIKDYPRDLVEKELVFGGFLIFNCPIKPHSKNAIKMLRESNHRNIVITGDNHFTAIHVAKELEMVTNVVNVRLDQSSSSCLIFEQNETEVYRCPLGEELNFNVTNLDLSVTGAAIDSVLHFYPKLLDATVVYSRASPSQKEAILTSLKSRGYLTLMCGDGTNDVGALKQSHVGVALLNGKPEDLDKIIRKSHLDMLRKRQEEMRKTREDFAKKFGRDLNLGHLDTPILPDEAEAPIVKLGDASVAAPFTSKISTIDAGNVCNIIRQGRCTLVTTIQMYKILALNSLISAFSLSVLHLAGIRYGDFQVTVTGMLLASCFLFLSKSRPLEHLSPSRPHSNIFNWYIILSVLLQFIVHVTSLVYIMNNATRLIFPRKLEDSKFEPNLLNTSIFLLSLSMQVSTFVVNYQGRPFREGLLENKPLKNSLLIVGSVAFICALELFPEANEYLELVVFPPVFKLKLLLTMTLDFGLCFAAEYLCFYFLSDAKSKFKKK